ncbi:MAG: helix-turn-helix transcriptional regulator, partial [Clostridia bacterium]|nr:helix-turn-helix transcriptional regulator [Clostridia bacterium]
LQVILDYIDKNYAHAITLQTLAEKINYSDSYVSLLFSKYSGMSYKEYIDRVRISKATELIRRGGKTFTEISVLCGYDTIRTFNNVFKRIMDCTPTEYKTEQTKNNHIINEDEC